MKITFADDHAFHIDGGRAAAEVEGDAIFMALPLHNVGPGLAILHSWHVTASRDISDQSFEDVSTYRRLSRDSHRPAAMSVSGRAPSATGPIPTSSRRGPPSKPANPSPSTCLYSDSDGGQRTVTRFRLGHAPDAAANEWYPRVGRHLYLDRPSPR